VTESGDILLHASDLEHTYGVGTPEEHQALGGITFDVRQGEFVAVVGPSGAGKTTLLRCLAGLLRPTSGKVIFEGQPVTSVPADLTLVFQDYRRSLYPWLRVDDNVDFPIRNAGLPKAERRQRVARALADVGLSAHARKYPGQLSGGMQQRVSIARALAYEPNVLLMDEPFAAVDAMTRQRLQEELTAITAHERTTVLFITHAIEEAVFLSDRVIALSGRPGRIVADLTIDLPRPRRWDGLVNDGRFAAYRDELTRCIHGSGTA